MATPNGKSKHTRSPVRARASAAPSPARAAQTRRVRDSGVATPAELEALVGAALRYATRARAPSTLETYAKQWRGFVTWCDRTGVQALPASSKVVAAYLAHRARQGRRPATIALDLAAISVQHDKAGK